MKMKNLVRKQADLECMRNTKLRADHPISSALHVNAFTFLGGICFAFLPFVILEKLLQKVISDSKTKNATVARRFTRP